MIPQRLRLHVQPILQLKKTYIVLRRENTYTDAYIGNREVGTITQFVLQDPTTDEEIKLYQPYYKVQGRINAQYGSTFIRLTQNLGYVFNSLSQEQNKLLNKYKALDSLSLLKFFETIASGQSQIQKNQRNYQFFKKQKQRIASQPAYKKPQKRPNLEINQFLREEEPKQLNLEVFLQPQPNMTYQRQLNASQQQIYNYFINLLQYYQLINQQQNIQIKKRHRILLMNRLRAIPYQISKILGSPQNVQQAHKKLQTFFSLNGFFDTTIHLKQSIIDLNIPQNIHKIKIYQNKQYIRDYQNFLACLNQFLQPQQNSSAQDKQVYQIFLQTIIKNKTQLTYPYKEFFDQIKTINKNQNQQRFVKKTKPVRLQQNTQIDAAFIQFTQDVIQQMQRYQQFYTTYVLQICQKLKKIFQKDYDQNPYDAYTARAYQNLNKTIALITITQQTYDLYLSGQRFWTLQDQFISNSNQITYKVQIVPPISAKTSLQKAYYVYQKISQLTKQTGDQHYKQMSAYSTFRQYSVKYTNRDLLLQRFKNIIIDTDNQQAIKYLKLLIKSYQNPQKKPLRQTPLCHGWFKKLKVVNPSIQNCLIQAYLNFCSWSNKIPSLQQQKRISQGYICDVFDQNHWNYYISAQPSHSKVNQNRQRTLYILPMHVQMVQTKQILGMINPRIKQMAYFGGYRGGQKKDKIDLLHNSIAFDVQTYKVYDRVQQIYLLTYWGYIDGVQVQGKFSNTNQKYLSGDQIMRLFINFLLQQTSRPQRINKPLYVYSYNGPHYQFRYLIRILLQYIPQINSFGSSLSSKGLHCLDGRLVFRDPKLLIGSGSLKHNASLFNQQDQQKYDLRKQELPKNYQEYQDDRQRVDHYCMMDSKSALLLVHNFYKKMQILVKTLKKNTGQNQYQVYKNWTASQFGISILQSVFCKQHKIELQKDQHYLQIQRSSNFGGMVGCNYAAFQFQICSLDINSAYPAAMTKPLPFRRISTLIEINQSHQINQLRNQSLPQMLSLYKVYYIRFNKAQHCFVPIRKKGSLTYPSQIKQQLYLWGPTIKSIVQNGGLVYFDYCIRYTNTDQKGKVIQGFKNFAQQLYKIRKHHKKMFKEHKNKQDQIMQSLIKLLINSAYGKFNQQLFPKKIVIHPQNVKYHSQYIKNQPNQAMNVLTFQSQIKFNTGNLVRLASYITALVRTQLNQAIQCLGVQNVVYYDTDSIYFRKSLSHRVLHLVDSQQLGKMKIQQNQYVRGVCLGPKMRFFQDKQGKIWPKSKGVKFQIQKDQILLNYIVQRTFYLLQNHDLGKTLKNKTFISKVQNVQRWISDKARTGNVIQLYAKNVNYYHRKILQARNESKYFLRPLTWSQFEQL